MQRVRYTTSHRQYVTSQSYVTIRIPPSTSPADDPYIPASGAWRCRRLQPVQAVIGQWAGRSK